MEGEHQHSGGMMSSEQYGNVMEKLHHINKKLKKQENDMATSQTEYVASGGGGYGGYGYGGGCGGGAFGAVGLVGLVGIGGLLGRNDGDRAHAEGTATRTLEQTIALMQFGQTATGQVVGAVEHLEDRLSDALGKMSEGLCNIRYENAQQTNTLLTAISDGTQAVKDQATNFYTLDLERKLAIAQQGGPIVRAGAFKFCDPCASDNAMNNVNQVLVQIGNGLTAVQNAVAALANAQ